MFKRLACTVLIISLLPLLSACTQTEKPSGQVIARVNGVEITVHQLNQVLSQSGNSSKVLRSETLEKLIDRQLALQQAQKLKLNQQPSVMLSLESARRDVLAEAFIKHISNMQFSPNEGEISAFYTAHPGLFSERKRYQLQLLSLNSESAYRNELAKRLAKRQTLKQIKQWLSKQQVPFSEHEVVRLSEQLPIEITEYLYQAKPGQLLSFSSSHSLSLYQLLSTEALPITLEDAIPVIKIFLKKQKHNLSINKELKKLRSLAKIEYSEQFQTAK